MLLAKLKIAIEPATKVEPIAVITIKLMLKAIVPIVLGIISLNIFLSPEDLKLKIGKYLKPELLAAGI